MGKVRVGYSRRMCWKRGLVIAGRTKGLAVHE